MQLTIIGRGRLGRTLFQLLGARGASVRLVGRQAHLPPETDLVLLTVPDSAISEVVNAIPVGPIVVHTSGVQSLDVLQPHVRVGSFHPLMTFPGPEIAVPDLSRAYVAIDGDAAVRAMLTELAAMLGLNPVHVPGDRRLYHAAAVLAGNLSTVLLALSGQLLAEAGVEPRTAREMLAPLAFDSLRNAIADPSRALTGPLVRQDHQTMAMHHAALEHIDADAARELYSWFQQHGRDVVNDPHR